MQTVLLLAVVMAGWSGWNIFSKLSTNTLNPVAVQFIFALCGAFAAPIFYCLLPPNVKWDPKGILFAAAAYVSTSIAVFAYVHLISKNNVSAIIPIANSYPVFVVLFAHFVMHESYSWQKAVGLLFVIAGVVMTAR